MVRKEIMLLAKDVSFYLTGCSDVASSDWKTDEWLYPLDWTYQLAREAQYFFPKDANGIPLRDYRGDIGCQYLVSRIAGYAFAHWHLWRTKGSISNLNAFLRMADWFMGAQRGRYEHHFSVAGMNPPWITCIAQGEAASVLCRAYIETGEKAYFQQACAALSPFLTSVDDGGLLSQLPDGRPFLEEYPGTKYRHVLNGCLYAMVGIFDVNRTSQNADSDYCGLFDRLIDAVGSNVGAWDIGGWSTYDYSCDPGHARNVNTMTYQVLQAAHLRYLGEVSGDRRLLEMGLKWKRSTQYFFKRLGAFYRKIEYRMESKW